MKKMVSIISIFLVLFLLIFSIKVYAESLNTNITTDKETVHPGETIKVNIDFGTNLGSYTVNVAYDTNLLEYVSAEGVTSANDTNSKVIGYFYDSTVGSNPSRSMSITFKAKENIITSNPTNLNITAEGLASPNGDISYDDIETPITKTVMIEPKYVDYNIALNYSGDIIKNVEKDMKIVISSTMGRSYEHTRIIADVTTPENATVKLLGTDSKGLEHDIIQSGWGDEAGDPIGGKNVVKELDTRGIFTVDGNYSITLKLINRDNSDEEIASKTFQIAVKDIKNTNTSEPKDNQIVGQNVVENKQEPTTLPKTGNTIYFAFLTLMAILITAYIYLNKKNQK